MPRPLRARSRLSPPLESAHTMKTAMSRFHIHDELTAPEGSTSVLKGALSTGGQLPNFLGVLAGWTDEEILEAIAYAALESFTAMINVAGDVPVDGSVEESRTARLRAA